MSKTAVDKVTGEGAKYVKAGKKAQEKAQVRQMASQWTGYNPSASIPPHSEVIPTPTHVAPTGSEHLSGTLFRASKSRQYEQARGAIPATSQMHPGGFGAAKATPATSSLSHPGGYGQVGTARATMGNMAPGAPRGMRSLPKAKPASGGSAAASSGPAAPKPKVRGNANTSATKALGGKKTMRTAVKQKASGGKAKLLGMVRLGSSKYAGRNAENLKKATGA